MNEQNVEVEGCKVLLKAGSKQNLQRIFTFRGASQDINIIPCDYLCANMCDYIHTQHIMTIC